MQTTLTSFWETLSWIISGIPEAIKNDLLFPTRSRSIEEQVVEKSRRRESAIQSQQDRLIYHVRKDKDLRRVIREQADLIKKLVKEKNNLKTKVRSLERENSDLRSRLKRSR